MLKGASRGLWSNRALGFLLKGEHVLRRADTSGEVTATGVESFPSMCVGYICSRARTFTGNAFS